MSSMRGIGCATVSKDSFRKSSCQSTRSREAIPPSREPRRSARCRSRRRRDRTPPPRPPRRRALPHRVAARDGRLGPGAADAARRAEGPAPRGLGPRDRRQAREAGGEDEAASEPAPKPKPKRGKTPPPPPPRTLSFVNQTWVCNGPVDLDSVTVTIDQRSSARDAVHLRDGCTGRIGQLDRRPVGRRRRQGRPGRARPRGRGRHHPLPREGAGSPPGRHPGDGRRCGSASDT